LHAHVAPGTFDAIVINGVFGWGIDSPADTELAMAETTRALAPGGIMVIGYNDTPDNHPSFVDVASPGLLAFAPYAMPKLGHCYAVPGDAGAHTYSFFRKV
jgi:SAM-dependent methyltransferase